MIGQKSLQTVFVVIPLAYLITLTSIAFYRSSQRHSVVNFGDFTGGAQSGIVSEQANSLSKLTLEDFHRVEVKHGRTVWEVRAKDAKYYPQDFVTHVNSAELTIFREKQDDVVVKSDAAKLYMGGATLSRAVLDGNIHIAGDNGLQVKTQAAEFDAAAKVFSADGSVNISGTGYEVNGQGFRYAVESGLLTFARDVHCRFDSGAKMPNSSALNGK